MCDVHHHEGDQGANVTGTTTETPLSVESLTTISQVPRAGHVREPDSTWLAPTFTVTPVGLNVTLPLEATVPEITVAESQLVARSSIQARPP